MKAVSFAVALLASVVSCDFAPQHPRNPPVPGAIAPSGEGNLAPNHPRNPAAPAVAVSGEGSFDQLIDHTNPALGTFKQRYWYSTQFWNGTGSPVIVFNPGEEAASGFTGYNDVGTLTGQYAQAVGGAGIVIEHRYWGKSSPFTELTAKNLTYLTVKQSVADMNYFAKNVKLPYDTTGGNNADKAPWVLVGGSYSGALSAWTATTAPGTFWAYHASSAPVEAIYDYWGYFYPIQQGMPANCSKDISLVIEHVDTVLTNGSASDKQALKTSFGLGTVTHDSDFARTLMNPIFLWQSSINTFLPFCDALEGAKAGQKVPGAEGVGLDVALKNYASYISRTSGCTAPDCYNSYNKDASYYHETTLDVTGGAGRQWQWMLCNEALGYWQTGAPAGRSTIVSRFVTADYWQQQCNFYFPDAKFTQSEEQRNVETQGWSVTGTKRLMFSNGEFDPWRSSGVSSAFRPGGPMTSTPEIPVFIVPNGIHVQDLYMSSVTPAILELRKQELNQMVSWIEEFYDQPSTTTSTTSTRISTSTSSTKTTTSKPTVTSTTTSNIKTSTSSSSTTMVTSTTVVPRTVITRTLSTTDGCKSKSARSTLVARHYQA